jgi:hypothetical protein
VSAICQKLSDWYFWPPGYVADAHAALGRHADRPGPELVGLVVGLVDRGPQLLGRQLVDLGEQLPRELDRVLLK